MIFLTLDTCVWIALLRVDFHKEDNLLEEMCFWIENKSVIHVVPENMIKEWNRHKIGRLEEAVSHFKRIQEDTISPFKNNSELYSTYKPDSIKEKLKARVDRIDNILTNISEKALQTPAIINDAATRNLNCSAPNHSKDSFRDTINILTLINHLTGKQDPICYFSTLNYKDFSLDGSKRYEIHNELEAEFKTVNLQYIFFDEKENFGKKLYKILRDSPAIVNFQDYLKDKEQKEEAKILEQKKSLPEIKIEDPDKDFLDNVKYIDAILLKRNLTSVEKDMLRVIIKAHESYRQYFLRKVGNDGLV
jgi:PIN domain